jgi:Transglycosylase SLT domain
MTPLLGEDLGRWAVRLGVLALLAALVPMGLVLVAFGALLGLGNGLAVAPAGGGPLRGGPPTQAALADIPPEQLAVMQQAAADSSCHLPWTVLAAIAGTESGFGRNMATSSAGAIGYGQFLPATWAAYGQGGDPYDYRDALPAMARYLCAAGAGQDLRRAIFAYNHADWYVAAVLQKAVQYGGVGASGGGLVSGWADRPALDQYDRRNYASSATWLQWRAADCSAAALAWLLGAYAVQVPSLDAAIAWIGPDTGISTSLGLLDATGAPLARAIAGRGLTPRVPLDAAGRPRPLRSIAELEVWLAQGPLLLDGARWFGEGHWFVAIGYDQNGVYIRDSSGWDTRYLGWARLYGEVGFSGRVVGVAGGGPG